MSDRLLHTKVSKRKPLKHFPKKEDGHDGDMQIVSIQGKGTYLCIKDKSEWKISEKFNPRNKFDTHIFDEITTRKISGKSGLVMTLIGQTTTTFDGSSYTKTIAEFGNGHLNSPGIVSSRGDNDLVLRTGNSATSYIQIIDGASGNILSMLDTNGYFDIKTSRTAAYPIAHFRNDATSGTADAYLELVTKSTDGDCYINLGYRPNESNWKQWSIGMDANDSDAFKILGETGDTTKLSIDDTSVDASFKLDTSGNATISGTVTSSAGVCGGPKVTNYVTNDADDTMVGTLTIDKNNTATDTSTTRAVHIDYDHTEICASGQTITTLGLDLDMNCESVTHVGTVNQTGVDIDMVAATDGTQTNTGINIRTSGGDENTGLIIDTSGTHIKLTALADPSNDYATLAVADTGDLTIATIGDGIRDSDLLLDIDGDIELNAATGTINFKNNTDGLLSITSTSIKSELPILIKEASAAAADVNGYGQLWVKDTIPEELCFTGADDGTDIIGIGKYHYETKFIGFYAGQTASYLPITGYILEGTSTTNRNEYQGFCAPYNGTIEKVTYRSEVAQDGNISFRVLEADDGTEIPGTIHFRKETAVDIADDIYQELDMTSPTTGSDYSPLTKGKIYQLYISTPSTGYDTNITIVFKWNITS